MKETECGSKLKIGAGIIVVMLTVLLSGCGMDMISHGTVNDETDVKDTSENLQTRNRLISIGLSQIGSESDWRMASTDSVQEALSTANGFDLVFDDAQQKQENQLKAVREFIDQGVDYIIIDPVVETGWDSVLSEARDAGIPVIVYDRRINVEDDSLYTFWL